MKHIVCNLLLFASLLLCPFGAFAENTITDVTVNPSSGSTKAVVVGDVIHNLNSVDVDLSFAGTLDDCKAGSAKCSYVLKLLGSEVNSGNISLTEKEIKEGGRSFTGNADVSNLTQSGSYTFEFTVTWKNNKSEDKTMTKNHSFSVKIYADPKSKAKETKGVLFHNQNMKLSTTTEGGNPSGWSFEWAGSPSDSREYLYKASNTTDEKKTESVKLKAINYAPDGETVWGTFTQMFNMTVWPAPSSNNEGLANHEVKSEERYILKAKVAGGDPSKWEYKWRLDGSLTSLDSELSDKHKVTKMTIYTYTLEVINAPTGMDASNEYHNTLTYEVKCWDIPTLTKRSDLVPVVFSGDSVLLGVSPKGGNASGWTYKWSEGKGTDAELNYKTSYTGTDSITKKITVQATNKTPSGLELFTGSLEFDVLVWSTPSAEAVGELMNEFFKGDVADFEVKTTGGDKDAWTYKWSFNGNTLPSEQKSKLTFNTSGVETSYDGEVQTHKVVVKNSPKGIKKAFVTEFEFKTTLWSEPTYKSHNASEPVTCAGRQNTLTIDVTGSSSKRWTYTWKKNGQPLSDVKTSVYKFTQEDVDSKVNDVYTVTAENRRDGAVIYSHEATFDVEAWPRPQVNGSVADCDHYWGNTIKTPMDLIGGFESGWSYTMTVNDEPAEGIDNNFAFTVPSDVENGKAYHIVCQLRNDHEGTNWFSKTYDYTLHGWSKGQVTAEEMDSIDVAVTMPSVRHSSSVYLHPNVDGGYNQGWSFAWNKNGEPLSDEKQSTLSFVANNSGDEYADDEYKLEYSNTLNEEVGTSGEIIYNMRIWAEARFPEKIEGPTVTRKEMPIKLFVEPGVNGYFQDPASNWHYTWEGYSDNKSEINFVEGEVSSFDKKDISEKTYKLHLVNQGPNGSVWDGKDYEHTIKIYNAPKTPDALKIKGNGRSHTMIALFDNIVDKDLFDREYVLVFGYSEGRADYTFDAKEHLRYLQFEPEVFKKINWVYAKWIYPDGSIVTSGKRYLDGHEEKYFDVSTFDGENRSPSDITGVEENKMDELTIEGNRFKAVLSQQLPARVSIYNVNGRLLDRQFLAERYEYNEPICTSQLRAGVYMVEVIVGAQRVVRKIYVH